MAKLSQQLINPFEQPGYYGYGTCSLKKARFVLQLFIASRANVLLHLSSQDAG